VLTTDQKGAIAETAITHSATKLGIDVYRPIAEGGRYDLIFGVGEHLLRIQCKWAPVIGDVIVVRCYSSRRKRDGLVRRVYQPGEFDAFAAYCSELDRCYFIPYERFSGRAQILLRLNPTKNNQNLGVNWAAEFDFVARLSRLKGP